MSINWNPIPNVREKVRGKLIGHRIKYWRQDLNEITESQYLLSRSTDANGTIIGLLPNTYYWVRVMAYNSAGPGPESERFLERTFKLRPQKPPTAVQVSFSNIYKDCSSVVVTNFEFCMFNFFFVNRNSEFLVESGE